MSAVRSFLRNRIALLLVMVSMIMGFIIPSIWTDYSDLAGLNQNTNEIHILDIRGMRDCILAVSPGGKSTGEYHDNTGLKTANGVISTAGSLSLPDMFFSARRLRRGLSFVPASPGIRTISSYLIIAIYLKDGSK